MKASTFVKRSVLGLAAMSAVLFAGSATAFAAQIDYNQGATLPSLTSPVFNTFTNVPYGVGDESDFVRIRTSTGDPTNSGTDGERNLLYADSLSTTCAAGDMFDVRTYVHNGADDDYNDNGNGPSVARGVKVAMTARLSDGKTFPFSSTITANNAETVTDNATLTCGRNVRLELVPGTVKANSKSMGWVNVSADAVNGKIKIGSRDMDSGKVWGCWDERVVVVYTVKVTDIPTTPETPQTPKTPETPKVEKLPSTGAGNTIAVFTATSFIGALLYRAKLLRSVR